MQRAAAGTLLLAALLVGCGEDATAPSAEQQPSVEATDGEQAPDDGMEQADIVISDFAYALPETVAPGADLVVRNEDSVGHTVTSDDGVFDVVVPPGDEVTFTVPDEPGEYPFHCTPHPAMTGTLVVG